MADVITGALNNMPDVAIVRVKPRGFGALRPAAAAAVRPRSSWRKCRRRGVMRCRPVLGGTGIVERDALRTPMTSTSFTNAATMLLRGRRRRQAADRRLGGQPLPKATVFVYGPPSQADR
jgi:hypothetical protein